MKQTFRRKKTVTIPSIIAGIMFLICVVISVIFLIRQDYLLLILLFLPFLLGITFALIAFFEHRGTIEIDDQKVKFNYRIFSKHRELNKSGVEFDFSKIESLRRTLIEGDGIITKDTYLYTICQTDKKQAEFYLFHFGKDEDLIFNSLKERLKRR